MRPTFSSLDRTELEALVYECERRGAYRTWNAIAREQTRRLGF